jgi:DNA invertase Pin-like site-specific DNA recombinase
VLEQPIDTTTSSGKLFFTMLAAFSEFEATIRAERQREGIDAALAKGTDSPFKGRPASIDPQKIAELRQQGISPTMIATTLGVARSSVYRLMNNGE